MPPDSSLPERLGAVLAVVYLIFNEGWGDGRIDLAAEAIRLGRALVELMPDESEAIALLSLMLINDARRNARFGTDGGLILLDDQDRSLWDPPQIDEAHLLLDRALALQGDGPYLLQAAIGDLHAQQPRDWQQIALLYEQLERVTGSAVVAMNRAIAIAEVAGPEAALAILDLLDLDDYRYYHSTRADLLRRLRRSDEAAAAYARALALAQTDAERRFLRTRLTELHVRAKGESHESRIIDPSDADTLP